MNVSPYKTPPGPKSPPSPYSSPKNAQHLDGAEMRPRIILASHLLHLSVPDFASPESLTAQLVRKARNRSSLGHFNGMLKRVYGERIDAPDDKVELIAAVVEAVGWACAGKLFTARRSLTERH